MRQTPWLLAIAFAHLLECFAIILFFTPFSAAVYFFDLDLAAWNRTWPVMMAVFRPAWCVVVGPLFFRWAFAEFEKLECDDAH